MDHNIERIKNLSDEHIILFYKLTRVSGLTFGKTYEGLMCYRDGEFFYNIVDDYNRRVSFHKSRFRNDSGKKI